MRAYGLHPISPWTPRDLETDGRDSEGREGNDEDS